MSEFERKPDGGLNAWIETYEAMGDSENDAEMLCLLLELRRRRENQAEAERERDELRAEQAEHDEQIARMESKFSLAKRALDSKTARCDRAEAELKRRDAAAGGPVAFRWESKLSGRTCYDGIKPLGVTSQSLYTDAPPAVLPPKYADELTERAELIEAYSKTQCEIAQELGCDSDNESILKAIYELKELGAQQQKVVELPDPADESLLSTWQLNDAVINALDTANVKWELKK